MDSNFLQQLGLSPAPKVSVYNNACLYYLNLIVTSMFLIGHLAVMMVIFNFWNRGDWLVIIYSLLQMTIGLYSLGLTLTDVAF